MHEMRRSKQALSIDETRNILLTGRLATLAVAGDEGYPYAVPVNYVYDSKSVYIHSARQGHKIDALARNPKCSLCVVDADRIVPEEFTTYFRSAILFGRAEFVADPEEKRRALRLLCEKYAPGLDPEAEIGRFFETVCIIRITPDRITGKEAIELVRRRGRQ